MSSTSFLEFNLEKLSLELDFIVADLFAISKQTTDEGEVRILLKKEIESSINFNLLKKLLKCGFLEFKHMRIDNQIRACAFLTEKAISYCNNFHKSTIFVF